VSVPAAELLAAIRERRPLVHQITNYVVMNETANATLALGALPVMAHAPQEAAEMAGAAGALVLNIGTLSEAWVEAMLLAGRAANSAGVPVVLDPVGAGATRYRTDTAKRLLDEVRVAVVRGNGAEVATLIGRSADIRGVEAIGDAAPAELARAAARDLGVVASVTGAVDHVSDGRDTYAVANGHALLATVTGTGCMSSAITGCFVAAAPGRALEAATAALAAFGVAGEDAARGARGPGSFHAALYDALYNLDPATIVDRVRVSSA
jgi:hydroxyethylthiazole kinase